MQLVNDFLLKAPRAAVWAALTDPATAVACMPGATLTQTLGEHAFKATVSLKVGPIKLQFAGEGELCNLSADGTYGEMRAKGSDSKGRGSFKTEMKFHVVAEGPQTRVKVETDLTLTGSVAQYGRGSGIVREVASQLTTDFTRNLEAKVLSDAHDTPADQAAQEIISSDQDKRTPETKQPATSIDLPKLVLTGFIRWFRSLFRNKL